MFEWYQLIVDFLSLVFFVVLHFFHAIFSFHAKNAIKHKSVEREFEEIVGKGKREKEKGKGKKGKGKGGKENFDTFLKFNTTLFYLIITGSLPPIWNHFELHRDPF
jgi:hypothetical protein